MGRVLIVRQCYYPDNMRPLRQATALTRAGHDVTVICLKNPNEKSEEILDGVRVIRLPLSWERLSLFYYFLEYAAFFFMAFVMVSAIALRKRFDAVMVANQPDILVFSALIPKLQGSHIVLDIRDTMLESYLTKYCPSGLERQIVTRLLLWEERLSAAFADGVLSVHRPHRDLIASHGIPLSKIGVFMNLPDPDLFKPKDRSGIRDWADENFFLVYHGTISPRFGIDLAVRAVAKARQSIPGIRLTIIGEGDGLDELVQLCRDLHLEDAVEFAGFVPYHRIPELLVLFEIGIVPHRSNPGMDIVLPTKLLEYMSIGLPSIVASTTAVRAIVDRSAVMFIQPDSVESLAEGIVQLYRNPSAAWQTARSAADAVRRLRIESSDESFCQFLFPAPTRDGHDSEESKARNTTERSV